MSPKAGDRKCRQVVSREGQAGLLGRCSETPSPLSRLPPTPLPEFTPQFHAFIVFSPSSLPALVFNSRSEFPIHLLRAQCRVTLPRLHFMFQCLERSGWRKTRSACPRTCVSVCAPGAGTDRPTEGPQGQNGGLPGARGAGLRAGEGQALRVFSHDFTLSPERL